MTATTIVQMGEADGYQQNGENCFDEECILLCKTGRIASNKLLGNYFIPSNTESALLVGSSVYLPLLKGTKSAPQISLNDAIPPMPAKQKRECYMTLHPVSLHMCTIGCLVNISPHINMNVRPSQALLKK